MKLDVRHNFAGKVEKFSFNGDNLSCRTDEFGYLLILDNDKTIGIFKIWLSVQFVD